MSHAFQRLSCAVSGFPRGMLRDASWLVSFSLGSVSGVFVRYAASFRMSPFLWQDVMTTVPWGHSSAMIRSVSGIRVMSRWMCHAFLVPRSILRIQRSTYPRLWYFPLTFFKKRLKCLFAAAISGGRQSGAYVRVTHISFLRNHRLIFRRHFFSLFFWLTAFICSGVGFFLFTLSCPGAPYLPEWYSSTSVAFRYL